MPFPIVPVQVIRLRPARDSDWALLRRLEWLRGAALMLAAEARTHTGPPLDQVDAVLEVDYRLACRCLDSHDFAEGVRAALIDKDGKPRWQPATLAEVTDADITAYFAAMPDGGLALSPREQIQTLR
mgnify:CR=1 FL=1